MQKVECLYLSQQDVVDVGLTLADAVGIVEGALREHGAGQVENPPKPGIHPLPDAFIHAMPGYLRRKQAAGMKWVSGFPGNPARGLPTIMGLIVLNDPATGQPIAVMDCAYITALRTAAASGVSARHLARRDAEVIGLVGAGLQGRYNLLVLRDVLPQIRSARVFDVDGPTLERFVTEMRGRLPFAVEPVGSARDAITSADVAVTATGHLDDRIFEAAWIKEGALVLPVHTRGWQQVVFERVDKFVVDDWGQFRHVFGRQGGYYWPLPEPYAELGQIVVGSKPGRGSDSERIINFNYGMGIHDVAMACEVLARAKAKGLGTPLTLMDGPLPEG